jgi:glycosyltransferase involved in cell wall biosynthesis
MLSVIIPCYNCVSTIEECIASLQVHSEIKQIICVINGCTDHTEVLIGVLAKKDDRIVPVKISESGPGIARNAGVPYVNQPFTFFMDADDYIHNSSFQVVLDEVRKDQTIDFISFEHTNSFSKLGSVTCGCTHFSNFKKYYKFCLGRMIFSKNIRIIKSELLKAPSVYYPKQMMTAEDMYFLQLLGNHVKNIKHVGVICYYYREDELGTGVVNNNSQERLDKKFKGLKWAQRNRIKSDVSGFLNRYYLVQYLDYTCKEFQQSKNYFLLIERFMYTFRPYGISLFRKIGYQLRFFLKLIN